MPVLMRIQRLMVLLLIATLGHQITAGAQNAEIHLDVCALVASPDLSPSEILDRRSEMDCSDSALARSTPHLWILLDIAATPHPWTDPAIRFPLSHHGEIGIWTIYEDGDVRGERMSQVELVDRATVPSMIIHPLERRQDKLPDYVVLSVEHPWDPLNWRDISLVSASEAFTEHLRLAITYAFIIGILLTPVVLSVVLYPILRYRFMLFHFGVMICSIGYGLSWAGFVQLLPVDITTVQKSTFNHVIIAVAFMFACLLTRELCGRKTLGQFYSNALLLAGAFVVIQATILMAFAPRLSHYGTVIHHSAFLLPLLVILASLIHGSLRGILICQLQLLAWSPMMVYIAGRIAQGTGVIDDATILNTGLYPSLVTEAILTTFIVGFRIYTLREERDTALKQKRIFSDLANEDTLTGALNRRAFLAAFGAEIKKLNDPSVLSLLVIDIDHFKTINDRFGHTVGDSVLRELVSLLQAHCRHGDTCARFGGEEFCLLLSTPTQDAADRCAERLREAVASTPFSVAGQVTVSIGIATVERAPDTCFDVCFAHADKALYQAKNGGRNRVARALSPHNQTGQSPPESVLWPAQTSEGS